MRRLIVSSATVSILVLACSDGMLDTSPQTTSVAQPILGGTADTTSHATVAVGLGRNTTARTTCTGSLLKVEAATGKAFVLTAAHCLDENRAIDVRIGNDKWNPDLILPVVAETVHPDYGEDAQGGLIYDFAMLEVSGATAALPAPYSLPAANDGLTAGSELRFVGYGNTVGYGLSQGVTNFRRSATKRIDSARYEILGYDQNDGVGPCDGDSGGPALQGSTVVGVTSYGFPTETDGDSCLGRGVSSRVSSGLPFIQAILDGREPPGRDACLACQENADSHASCVAKRNTCDNDADCRALLQCLQTSSSSSQCLSQHPNGQGPLFDMFDCACSDACATECSGKPSCEDSAACGVQFTNPTYAQCMESSCCAETDRAAADPLGYRCLFERVKPAGCADNAAFQAYESCAAQCETRRPDAGAPDAGEEPGEEPAEEDDTPSRRDDAPNEGGCSLGAAGTPGVVGPTWSILGAALLLLRRRSRA